MEKMCVCTHSKGLHVFFFERCIKCQCPVFGTVESSVVAELNFSTVEYEDHIPHQSIVQSTHSHGQLRQ